MKRSIDVDIKLTYEEANNLLKEAYKAIVDNYEVSERCNYCCRYVGNEHDEDCIVLKAENYIIGQSIDI